MVENTLEITENSTKNGSKTFDSNNIKNTKDLKTTENLSGQINKTKTEFVDIIENKTNKGIILEILINITKKEEKVNTTNNRMLIGLPEIDFTETIKEQFIDVEYQSAHTVILRADEDKLLLSNRTLIQFWHAIDLVKNYGYKLKEIAESGLGSKVNPTRFYAILEKE